MRKFCCGNHSCRQLINGGRSLLVRYSNAPSHSSYWPRLSHGSDPLSYFHIDCTGRNFEKWEPKGRDRVLVLYD